MQPHRRLRALAIGGALAAIGARVLFSGAKPARALDAPPSTKAIAPAAPPHAPPPAPPPPPLELTVLGEGVPTARTEFTVSADGKRSYFAEGSAYYVFDEKGDAITRIPTTGAARSLAILPDGRFISAQSHAAAHIALLRPDGAESRSLVARGASPQNLRIDKTNWTTPTGLAVDPVHQLMFALDTTVAPAGTPDPDWSRVAVFDTRGQYIRSVAGYDASNGVPSDEHRTWYDDIEVDPKRSVFYVTARAQKQLWAFNYDGAFVGRAPGVGGIAVLPNGSVAVGAPDRRHVTIYDPALKVLKTLNAGGVLDLEADAAGRLYASVADPMILYLRWPAGFTAEPEIVRPRFQHITVGMPFERAVAGASLALHVAVSGRPVPTGEDWHVFVRPSDGSDLNWKELDSKYEGKDLTVRVPAELRGLNDLAVRYGKGAISRVDGSRDVHVEKTILFTAAADDSNAGIRSVENRAAFQRGEAIPFRIEARAGIPPKTANLWLQRAGETLASITISLSTRYWELPSAITRRLMPGHYVLAATVDARSAIPYEFDIAESEPDSPVQRILYHEFEQTPASMPQNGLLDTAERLAFIRHYSRTVAELGFTRETDRSALKLMTPRAAGSWRSDSTAEPAAYDVLPQGGLWEPDFYLDRATANGIHFDTQLLGHCSGVRLADSWFPPLNSTLQRLSQWFGRYPSFYGFNYNDEAFFADSPFGTSIPADQAWLDATAAGLVGRPKADTFRAGLAHMYSKFDAAVTEVRPDLARTTTPMWQYPAALGSYAPTIYAHMTESYSHYLSEGYGWPWYPAHSVAMLRRPGLPVMGVFDNGFSTGDGESYLKDALQVLGRGVQGIGLEHHHPLRDTQGSDAIRVMNGLAQMYGSVFAEAEPDNEAAVLYSYAQDTSEKLDNLGTPHWERVFALYGAGLMAGIPMSTVYEEDVAQGALLRDGKPKVKFLFLVGQKAELPASVKAALASFTGAGGAIVVDADSVEPPSAIRFPSSLLEPVQAAQSVRDGDGVFPTSQPGYERIANALHSQFGAQRRFPVDTDDLWVSKNRFDGGAIRYVLIASETGPYPWDPGTVWNVGARYNKSYWPKRVALSVPRTAVIYDAFERKIVSSTAQGDRSLVQADLTTFPGKLYALAPRELSAPKLSVRVSQSDVTYSVDAGIAGRVPLRVLLTDDHGQSTTVYRGTNLRGEFERTVARPAGSRPWRLEVAELLGGTSSSVLIPPMKLVEPLVRSLPYVETERELQIRALLTKGPRELHVVGALDSLPSELRTALLDALKAARVHATIEPAAAASATQATYLLLGKTNDASLGEPARTANQLALFGHTLSAEYPGPSRGIVSAAFAARSYGENCIVLIGGDQSGLNAAATRFITLLRAAAVKSTANSTQAQETPVTLRSTPGAPVDVPKLSQRVGVRLSGIRASGGKLALAANGYLGNFARVDDEGDHGRVVAVSRVGESPTTTSLFLSDDGQSYGVAARSAERFGQAFSLWSTSTGKPERFTSFGDFPTLYTFAAASDGKTVLAPGPYGIVAWQRGAMGWREAWSVDYWKHFDAMDWPTAAGVARAAYFAPLVPRHGNIALVAFSDLTDGSDVNSTRPIVQVTARSLRDGGVRWAFTKPSSGVLESPKLFSNGDGSLVVLETQLGGIGSARFSVLTQGRIVGSWASGDAPLASEMAEETGRFVAAYGGGSRLLEVRFTDGTAAFSKTLDAQPTAVTFAEDGASVIVSDEAGALSRFDGSGNLVWRVQLGCTAQLARDGARLYAAGWNGRLYALTLDGHERWRLDLTGPMGDARIRSSSEQSSPKLETHEPARPSSVSTEIPSGVDLLRSGQATLKVGGTRGWKSKGTVEVEASTLTNGNLADNDAPWIATGDLFWDGAASRKVWAEMDLKQPTSIHSLSVYENPKFPDSWPTETLIQVWDSANERWRTAKHGVFVRGSKATYVLNLKRVTKLRYVPWSNYFHNFHTSEIELR